MTWSHDNERVSIRWTGPFRLTDDERDIAWLEDGAELTMADGSVLGSRIEFVARNGQIERRYYVNGLRREYEPEGRAFVARLLERVVRNTSMFAAERVARFLKRGGPDAVLAEIERVESSHARGVYYRELIKQSTMTSELLTRILQHAPKAITSDHERGALLMAIAAHAQANDAHRATIATATKSMSSSHEKARTLKTVLATPAASAQVAAAVIDAVGSIDSSHERSNVLIALSAQSSLPDAANFFAAVAGLRSSMEARRVLTAVLNQSPLSENLLLGVLRAIPTIESSMERARLLVAIANRHPLSSAARAAYLAAAEGISSDMEKNRALAALVRQGR